MHLVLLGAGHSHLFVAGKSGDFLKEGIEITLVSPGAFWYSGLATGVLGGQYPPEEDRLDPEKLIRSCGGVFIRDEMVRINPEEKTVTLVSGLNLSYDALSLNIGSEVPLDAIPGASKHAWTVKPISNLWRLRQKLEERFKGSEIPVKVIVIGGGPTGCEVAVNIASLAERTSRRCDLTLIAKSGRVMSGNSQNISTLTESVLKQKGATVLAATTVEEVQEGKVVTDRGTYQADFIIAATGLAAPVLLSETGISQPGEEGLKVNSFLQSVKFPAVFGAGDCIAFQERALPKLGVFGVREAPILAHNLSAYLLGKAMKPYIPQKKYLSILNWGDGKALAIREPLFWNGRMSYWLKDYLDRSFLNHYRRLYQ